MSFVRWSQNEKLIIISNFDAQQAFGFDLKLPQEIVQKWGLENKTYTAKDELFKEKELSLIVKDEIGHIRIDIQPLESLI